jgi:hypothetical protein
MRDPSAHSHLPPPFSSCFSHSSNSQVSQPQPNHSPRVCDRAPCCHRPWPKPFFTIKKAFDKTGCDRESLRLCPLEEYTQNCFAPSFASRLAQPTFFPSFQPFPSQKHLPSFCLTPKTSETRRVTGQRFLLNISPPVQFTGSLVSFRIITLQTAATAGDNTNQSKPPLGATSSATASATSIPLPSRPVLQASPSLTPK